MIGHTVNLLARVTPWPDPVYWAVIGDIVHSRALKDRAAWQRRLEAVLSEADQRFGSRLAGMDADPGG